MMNVNKQAGFGFETLAIHTLVRNRYRAVLLLQAKTFEPNKNIALVLKRARRHDSEYQNRIKM